MTTNTQELLTQLLDDPHGLKQKIYSPPLDHHHFYSGFAEALAIKIIECLADDMQTKGDWDVRKGAESTLYEIEEWARLHYAQAQRERLKIDNKEVKKYKAEEEVA